MTGNFQHRDLVYNRNTKKTVLSGGRTSRTMLQCMKWPCRSGTIPGQADTIFRIGSKMFYSFPAMSA